jgi:HEAT repeat protein
VRRLALVFALLAASPALRADPAETPFLVFREADPETAEFIKRDLLAEKSLAGRVPETRRQTREEIARIGPWCVPFLVAALRKETARIRLNAVLALAMIRDPRGLPALREAAAKDDNDKFVRRAATLSIALFEWPKDFETLKGFVATQHGEWRSIAPALARLRVKEAAALLGVAAARLPRDEHDAAAIVLASAIAGADVPLVDLLEDRRNLVQEAAAAGLAVRPLAPQRAGEILAALGRSAMSDDTRVLAIRALGAIDPRPDDAQAGLMKIACGDGKAAERIAALLELRGTADEFDPLWRAYRKLLGRNDPVVAALLLALARTRETKAVETLLDLVRTEADFLRFYAAAALLRANGSAELPDETWKAVVGLRDMRGFEDLADLAQKMKRTDEAVRRTAARELRDIDDPRTLKLYFDREERNWLEVNRLLTRIFELGEVLTRFDSAKPHRTTESPLPGGGSGGGDEAKKTSTGSDAEQDLFDLLIPPRVASPSGEPPYPERKPYFGPGDIARG